MHLHELDEWPWAGFYVVHTDSQVVLMSFELGRSSQMSQLWKMFISQKKKKAGKSTMMDSNHGRTLKIERSLSQMAIDVA